MVRRLKFFIFILPFLLTPSGLSSSKVWGAENQGAPKQASAPKTRTVVADLLMIDGNFYVVRGERGEIRIEVTPDTHLSETFKFGDRIKAILLPNDEALSITRAGSEEAIGIKTEEPAMNPKASSSPAPPASAPASPPSPAPAKPAAPKTPPTVQPQNRIIIADLLMVDRNLYIVRTEKGEIQIEITPQTQLAEKFKFGDRIKALVKPNDTAISVERASADEPSGIRMAIEPGPQGPSSLKETGSASASPPLDQDKAVASPPVVQPSQTRTIIAEILMVDGDFYVVRGERGEIRIEITPNTHLTEKFKFGDKIKAVVLPNDQAVSVERVPR